jgi:lipopolysaccharide/colanic/teichoic acid biosynthesis glycosyltransferase
MRVLVAVLVAGDVAAVLTGAALATLLTRRWLPGAHLPHGPGLVAVMPALAVLAFLCGRLYAPSTLLRGAREFSGAIHGCGYAATGTILAGFVVTAPIPRLWTGIAWCLAAAAVCCVRLAARRAATRLRRRGLFVERALLVGADQHSLGVARQLSRPGSGTDVIGVLDDYRAPGTVLDGRFEVLGTPADLARVAAARGVTDLIVVPDAMAWETMRRVLAGAATTWAGGRVHLSAGFIDLLTTGVRVSERNHVPLLTLKGVTLTPVEAAAKRGLDCVLALLLLAAFAPVMAVTALRRRRLGRVLRRRPVVGRGGVTFAMPEFEVGASSSGLVRKLPALTCVLRGEMSMVGPRPQAPAELPPGDAPAIRPGLTGPWREGATPAEQTTLDLCYVRSYSLWMDLQVLWVRVRARLLPGGSHAVRPAVADAARSPHGAR